MRVSRQLRYVVLKSFRFAGRGYEPGAEFNPRRADPSMGRLRKWCEDGFLCLPGEEPEPQEPSDAQRTALESMATANAPEEEQETSSEPDEGAEEAEEDAPDPEEEQ